MILDEFQEIHRFGGEAAEWRLPGSIQHHQRVSYVLAGSDSSLIRAMTGPKRAFYEMFDLLALGPMDPDHLSRWIDERLSAAGATIRGLGHGGTARNTALALMGRGLLERRESLPSGYGFDSPFARAWVIAHALPDVGLLLPIDHTGRPDPD